MKLGIKYKIIRWKICNFPKTKHRVHDLSKCSWDRNYSTATDVEKILEVLECEIEEKLGRIFNLQRLIHNTGKTSLS